MRQNLNAKNVSGTRPARLRGKAARAEAKETPGNKATDLGCWGPEAGKQGPLSDGFWALSHVWEPLKESEVLEDVSR